LTSWNFSTADPCRCDWLARAVAEPGVPIEFDGGLNEYALVHDGPNGRGRMVLRYCPFCGGAAPKSARSELFTRMTNAELSRLGSLTNGLKTLDEVVSALGPPDHDMDDGIGIGEPSRSDHPPTFERCRTLVYRNLSETVVVHAYERADGRVRFTFSGKQLRPAHRSPPDTDDSPDDAA
jgi:hypothetical protein